MQQLELDDFRFAGGQPWRDEAVLRELYVERDLSYGEIAGVLDCSLATISDWMGRHGIEVLDPTEGLEPLRDAGWLRERYVEQDMSQPEIADLLGTGHRVVAYWLNKHDIPIGTSRRGRTNRIADEEILRWLYEDRELTTTEIGSVFDRSVSTVRKWLHRHGIEVESGRSSYTTPDRLRDPDWVRTQYVKNERPIGDIAEEVECADSTVYGYLKLHGIPVDKGRFFEGEKNPAWEGGCSISYGKGWSVQRKAALERDGYSCRRCGVSNEEHNSEHGQGLHVHHIEKLASFEEPEKAHRLSNLLTLCRSCHLSLEGVLIDNRGWGSE